MNVSGDVKRVYASSELIHRRGDEADGTLPDYAFDEIIPLRYRNGQGGIDLERVRRDRQEARRQVVKAMIRSLGKMWRQR